MEPDARERLRGRRRGVDDEHVVRACLEVGDPEGEQRTYHFYNISDKKQLEKVATEKLKASKYTGFKGVFETFGQPLLHHGDRLKMTSTKLPERDGVYLVKSVKRSFSVSGGYRQIFELGFKVG